MAEENRIRKDRSEKRRVRYPQNHIDCLKGGLRRAQDRNFEKRRPGPSKTPSLRRRGGSLCVGWH
jgi:hypothetical protein